jgi:hypothetical protein
VTRIHRLRHNPLQGRIYNKAQHVHHNDRVHHPTLESESVENIGHIRRRHTRQCRPSVTESLQKDAEQTCLNDRTDNANHKKRSAILLRSPAESKRGLKHPGGLEMELAKNAENVDQNQIADSARLRQGYDR